jgi:hypothetical protein
MDNTSTTEGSRFAETMRARPRGAWCTSGVSDGESRGVHVMAPSLLTPWDTSAPPAGVPHRNGASLAARRCGMGSLGEGPFHCTQTLQTQEIETVARFTGEYPWGEPDLARVQPLQHPPDAFRFRHVGARLMSEPPERVEVSYEASRASFSPCRVPKP